MYFGRLSNKSVSSDKASPLFQRYQLIVGSDQKQNCQQCRECGHIHNRIEQRNYAVVKPSICDIPDLIQNNTIFRKCLRGNHVACIRFVRTIYDAIAVVIP